MIIQCSKQRRNESKIIGIMEKHSTARCTSRCKQILKMRDPILKGSNENLVNTASVHKIKGLTIKAMTEELRFPCCWLTEVKTALHINSHFLKTLCLDVDQRELSGCSSTPRTFSRTSCKDTGSFSDCCCRADASPKTSRNVFGHWTYI